MGDVQGAGVETAVLVVAEMVRSAVFATGPSRVVAVQVLLDGQRFGVKSAALATATDLFVDVAERLGHVERRTDADGRAVQVARTDLGHMADAVHFLIFVRMLVVEIRFQRQLGVANEALETALVEEGEILQRTDSVHLVDGLAAAQAHVLVKVEHFHRYDGTDQRFTNDQELCTSVASSRENTSGDHGSDQVQSRQHGTTVDQQVTTSNGSARPSQPVSQTRRAPTNDDGGGGDDDDDDDRLSQGERRLLNYLPNSFCCWSLSRSLEALSFPQAAAARLRRSVAHLSRRVLFRTAARRPPLAARRPPPTAHLAALLPPKLGYFFGHPATWWPINKSPPIASLTAAENSAARFGRQYSREKISSIRVASTGNGFVGFYQLG